MGGSHSRRNPTAKPNNSQTSSTRAHKSSNYTRKAVATCTAALMATTFETLPASAQGSYAPPPGSDQEAAPPSGSYAEPPPGEDQGGDYDDQAQQQDEQYAQSYSEW